MLRSRPMEITSLLTDFLKNPSIEVHVSDSKEIIQLRDDLEKARLEAARACAAYGREVTFCLRYEDYLRSIGVDPATVR